MEVRTGDSDYFTFSAENSRCPLERYGKIGVLMGGPSAEREISLKSGKAVFTALTALGLDALPIDIRTDEVKENIGRITSSKINCAFIALHGRFGEDGQIQGILDILNIAYTGSGALASKLSMDKVSSKQVLEIHGLTVPRYKVVDKFSYNPNWKLYTKLEFPVVVKPANGGSSIGLSIVDSRENLDQAVKAAFNFDQKLIIEEYIPGREVTVGILEEKALAVIEIIPKKRFFDYEAKYSAGMTDYVVPAQIEETVAKNLQSVALYVHKSLGCFGYSRVDIMLGEDNRAYVLELNSIPGLTPTSLLPKAAKSMGIDFAQLCLKMMNTAYAKRKKQNNLHIPRSKKFNT